MPLKLYSGEQLDIYSASAETSLELPFLPFGVSAGFPSPAMDFMEMKIDLNQHLIKHPAATFYGRVNGNSMKDEGIESGDLLIIDRAIVPTDGVLAVCVVDGEFTLKRLAERPDGLYLMPSNKEYQPIKIEEYHAMSVWGVVSHVIKQML